MAPKYRDGMNLNRGRSRVVREPGRERRILPFEMGGDMRAVRRKLGDRKKLQLIGGFIMSRKIEVANSFTMLKDFISNSQLKAIETGCRGEETQRHLHLNP